MRPRLTRLGAITGGIAVGALVLPALSVPVLAHAGELDLPTDPVGIATAWNVDPVLIVPLLLSAAGYLWLVRTVGREHPANRWPARRTAWWLLGLASIALALLSPIDTYSDVLLTVHMIQHMLLTSVAPILLASSGIGTLVLRAAGRARRDRVFLPILRSHVVSVLTFPLVGWVAYATIMWGSHFSSLYNLSLVDERVHALEHFGYLFAACLFWWPVFSPDPLRWRMKPLPALGYVLTQMPQWSFLAAALLNASRPLYPAYVGRTSLFGIDPLVDQQAGAALMWVMGDMAFIVALVLIVRAWLAEEEASSARIDARLDRERGEGIAGPGGSGAG